MDDLDSINLALLVLRCGLGAVMLAHGIRVYPAGEQLDVHVEPLHIMAFDARGLSLDPSLRRAA